ncbi:MAG TPA: hypothetical protein VE134_07540, partial [Methanomicrobiales archaeon]|nr:hypothetical protein [Methanomicrobiales archaeon]
MNHATYQESPLLAIVFSTIGGIIGAIGGILIVISGVVVLIAGASVPTYAGALLNVSVVSLGIWGIICGGIVLYASYAVFKAPVPSRVWGIALLIFSILSFIDG